MEFTPASEEVTSCEFSTYFSEHFLLQKFGNFYKFGKTVDDYIVMGSNSIMGHLRFIYDVTKGDFKE